MSNHYNHYIITGAGRGIGREIARSLGKPGAKIALVSRTEADLIETAKTVEAEGGEPRVFAADLSESGLVHEMANQILKEFGHLCDGERSNQSRSRWKNFSEGS